MLTEAVNFFCPNTLWSPRLKVLISPGLKRIPCYFHLKQASLCVVFLRHVLNIKSEIKWDHSHWVLDAVFFCACIINYLSLVALRMHSKHPHWAHNADMTGAYVQSWWSDIKTPWNLSIREEAVSTDLTTDHTAKIRFMWCEKLNTCDLVNVLRDFLKSGLL